MSLFQQKKWIVIISLFSYASSFAFLLNSEESPNDPPGDGDAPPAPIDNYLLLLAFVAIGLGYFFLMKYRRKTNNA